VNWRRKYNYAAVTIVATLSGMLIGSAPAMAGSGLDADCCADLEARVAELESTTLRKGNKKLSVTLSGWVFKMGTWWNDGHETNLYWGDGETTLASHVEIATSVKIAPEWSTGSVLRLEWPGDSASVGIAENQFNDNAWIFSPSTVNTIYSYLWVKSDKWGTVNWGQLRQATNDVGLLPDLSNTLLKSNAVVYNGAGMFVRPQHAKNSTDLATDFIWLNVVTCLAGAGIGADCNGYPDNVVSYDSPTFAGFSISNSYGEDDMWDIAVKYAADWGAFKVSAAYGFSNLTDEGCLSPGVCSNIPFLGGGGAPLQGYKKDVDINQVGISVMHVPSGLFAYGYYEQEDNNGTRFVGPATDANNPKTWFAKAGIRHAWSPLGHTVIWADGGQYFDQFTGLCGRPNANPTCIASINTSPFDSNGNPTSELVNVIGSRVDRWGAGIQQEIDSASMHLFFRWQHLALDLDATFVGTQESARANFDSFDLWQAGAVMFF
jgi:predicted porin